MPDSGYSADRLVRLLAALPQSEGPLHRQLAGGLAELIDRGEIPPGGRLPAERPLAGALGLSRTTVVAAYGRLEESGRIDRRQGSGTRVQASLGSSQTRLKNRAGRGVAGIDGSSSPIDLAAAALPALDMVADATSSMTRDDCLRLTRANHAHHLRGLPSLRERIARWYTTSGSPTTPEEILVTSGAQKALDLVTHGCISPGDFVITEDPTYRGALDTFERNGAQVQQIPVGRHGVDVDALRRAFEDRRPALAYLQPGLHNPTGVVLSPTRREKLISLIKGSNTIVVDDTVLSGTVFESTLGPPAMTSHARLITIGSMNKLFWGGLRLGWIRATPQVISRLAMLREATDAGTSLIAQEIGARLLDRVTEAEVERRRQLPGGLLRVTELLSLELPDWTWHTPSGGTALWVRLPHGNATHLAHIALGYGVAILPGTSFSRSGQGDSYVRLPYGLPFNTLETGITRLRSAWEGYSERGAADLTVMSSMT